MMMIGWPLTTLSLRQQQQQPTTDTQVPLSGPHQAMRQARPGQTRPDQTRPDQTRPDQTRPDQTRPGQANGPGQTSSPHAQQRTVLISDKLKDRKELFYVKDIEKYQKESLARRYNWKLEERIHTIKSGTSEDGQVVGQVKEAVNKGLVPSVQQGVDSFFKKLNEQKPADLLKEVVNKIQELVK
eukprot:scaffold37_cov172-Ochromonas_danica.AAC.7